MNQQAKDFLEKERETKKARVACGLSSGPSYGDKPLVWYDQTFEVEAAPTGTIEAVEALRVGATRNALDCLIVASHANESDLRIPADATLTLSLAQSDSPDGEFEEVGPTICVKAPAQGMMVERDHLVCRFPLGDMTKAWAKVKLEISGAITGGTIDIALGYVPR